MNDLIVSGNPPMTMSSLDLLELVNQSRAEYDEQPVRRNDFNARCMDELEGENYETFVVANQNGTQSFAISMTKDQCMYVLMRESKSVRRNVVQKLNEVEAAHTPGFMIPATLSEALRLAADQAEQIEDQQRQIEASKPAVKFLENFVEARSTKSLREVAKVLGIKERGFIGMLEDDGILFRQSGSLLPMAVYQHKGYFEVKTGEANGHVYHQTRFTPAGVAWVANRYCGTSEVV